MLNNLFLTLQSIQQKHEKSFSHYMPIKLLCLPQILHTWPRSSCRCILEFLLMATSIIWTYTSFKDSKELKASSDILDSELSSIVLNKQENLRKIVHASTAGMCYMLTKAAGMDMLPSDFCWYVWKLLLWWFYARQMVIYSKTMYTCDYYGKFTIKFVQQQHY